MDAKTFNEVIEEQIKRSTDVMLTKAGEYSRNDDRLHNFKAGGALRGQSPRQALAGMMLKHTVSVYDMCNDDAEYSASYVIEKITDHINYLLLLRAIFEEEFDKRNSKHHNIHPNPLVPHDTSHYKIDQNGDIKPNPLKD